MDSTVSGTDAWLDEHANEIAAETAALVQLHTESFPKPNNQEAALQERVSGRLQKLGFTIDQWEPDLTGHPRIPKDHNWKGRPLTVGKLAGAGSGKSIIINGHCDTVPISGDWQRDPFGGQIEDGKVWGRGSCDMKGGIAAALAALDALQACGIKLKGEVQFWCVSDEELGGFSTIAAAERGYRADAAVIPEPTDLNIFAATRGILWGKMQLVGREGHAEVDPPPWQRGGPVNADQLIVQAANGIMNLGKKRRVLTHPLLSPPDTPVTMLQGGDAPEILPSHAYLQIDATYMPYEKSSDVKAAIEQAALADDDGWLAVHRPTWDWQLDYPPYEIAESDPLVQAALEAMKRAGKQDVRPVGLDSGYDGTLLANYYGIPSIGLGPGSIRQAHAENEFVEISQLVTSAKALANLLVLWCGTV
ncbi:MAG TPA: ArgE/DapE family deacylase [Candidatus Saccharimonadales bacterium]|nr:ArgE/DapE family deacylase [Candidatus Saccharimonadales bacterium]